MPAADAIELTSRLRADPSRAAILTDFDGTLSPIVDDPDAARPLPGALDVLRALAARYAVVAVVSGRPLSFLSDRFGDPGGVVLSGLYGLEWVDAEGRRQEHPDAVAWRPVVAAVADQADAEAGPDTIVERKGLSVVLHVRTAPERDQWARQWATAQAAERGLGLLSGRKSYELRPPVDADKATVVTDLVGGLAAACFLGDDIGDLPAFDALDRLAAARGLAAVKLAVRSAELPPELLARADAVVDGPEGALAVLRSLLETGS